MKKKILLFLVIIFSGFSALAAENRLYFTESNDRLYYESKLINEKVFMKHLDMVPGNSFVDELLIENGTNTLYTLYFKVVPVEQSEKANLLLENIIMRITLDGKEIYNGKATGLDYSNLGVNLQNVIKLKAFKPSETSKMVVETTLSTEYSDTTYNDFSYIDWSFYGQYGEEEPIEIVEVPNTMKNRNPIIYVISLSLIIIGVIIFGYESKKQKE